jgi:RNA polymerase sigma factor (TIGR02999 family)
MAVTALLESVQESAMTEPISRQTTAKSADTLFADVYARLKAMAARQRSRASGATLETTALVHELYLRMSEGRELVFEHQAQFFTYAARAMRHLLSDRARDRLRHRAGGDWLRVTLTGGNQQFAIESAEQALALDSALQHLEETDTRAAKVLELHYFAGLTIEQIAATLDVAPTTIDRDWRFARAFLKNEIGR